MSTNNNFKEDTEANRYKSSPIVKQYDYLKGDSVTKISLYYNYTESENCFHGIKKNVVFDFVDDKLYQIRISIYFPKTNFSECIENYNNLVSIFKAKLPFYYNTISENSETKEQIGEGMKFYPTSEKNRNNIKTNNLLIDYNIKYKVEKLFNSSNYSMTNNVDEYVIEINYVNLNDTKLTGKGF
ncbi:hypothetical protein SAMN02927903_03413 [Flavobacterium caeni]|uniref:Uncharacterized protein n=2 Tax=Flavobacterium caeni TaxID=490189 RepID=A0A1G5KPW9_9FLAO|nr:hypothetical protein SAMN02927903_03413 [Flavobacterium caeni]